MKQLNNNKGFTLIELLVVVLIIGILAAVLFPIYQRSVAKSRAVQLMTAANAAIKAQGEYYLAVGKYANDLLNTDISFPGLSRATSNAGGGHRDELHAKDWFVYSYINPNGENNVGARFSSGAYKGAGFWYAFTNNGDGKPVRRFLCIEMTAEVKTAGMFCEKVMNGRQIYSNSDQRLYAFPGN